MLAKLETRKEDTLNLNLKKYQMNSVGWLVLDE